MFHENISRLSDQKGISVVGVILLALGSRKSLKKPVKNDETLVYRLMLLRNTIREDRLVK